MIVFKHLNHAIWRTDLSSSTKFQDSVRDTTGEDVTDVTMYSPLDKNVLKSALQEVSDELRS